MTLKKQMRLQGIKKNKKLPLHIQRIKKISNFLAKITSQKKSY